MCSAGILLKGWPPEAPGWPAERAETRPFATVCCNAVQCRDRIDTTLVNKHCLRQLCNAPDGKPLTSPGVRMHDPDAERMRCFGESLRQFNLGRIPSVNSVCGTFAAGRQPMRILFLTQYFPPEVGALANRVSENARVWAARGAEVTIVTCAPNYPQGKLYPGYRNRLFQRETWEGIEVIRLWTLLAANQGVLWRTLKYVSLLVAASLAAPFLRRPDVVVSTSPDLFCGMAGWVVARLRRRPWVLEIRDLWPAHIAAVGALRHRFLLAPFEWLERAAYRKADMVIPVTDSYVAHILERGGAQQRIRVVKNGAELSRFGAADGGALRRRLALEDKFVVAYVGTHGMTHRLETVLYAAARLKHRPDIVFLMVGDGAELQRLRELHSQLKLDNVIMLGQVPSGEVPEIVAAIDVSLVLLANDPLFRTVIPSKIFDAMALAKPIILGVDGEARSIVEGNEAGIAIEPENVDQLIDAVLALEADRERCAALGRNGRRTLITQFDRTKLAEKYLEILHEVARASDPVAVEAD